MRKIFDKIFCWLNEIGKDKYQHFAVGAVLSGAVSIIPLALGLVWWISLFLSFVVTLGVAMGKERCYDAEKDVKDILYTLAGGAVGWVLMLVMALVML